MSEFTLGSMYWINPKYSLEDFREDMRRIKENKITLLRIFIQWEYVETEKNQFDFSMFDTFFRAAEEAGIGLMPTLLFYLPYHRLVEQEENGRSDGRRRYPCLDRPEIREGVELFFTETVRRYKDSPALAMWNPWNEPTDYFCKCPHSLDRFAAWLKQKYPDMEALKEGWAGEYAVFKPILPQSMDELNGRWLERILSLPLRGRDTSLQLDAREFQAQHSAEHLAYMSHLIRKIDSDHPIQSNPAVTFCNPIYNGISPWKLAKVQDSISGSIHPHCMFPSLEPDPSKYPRTILSIMDVIRSWGDGKDSWIGEYQGGATYAKNNAYTPRGTDVSAMLYHSLAHGLRGVVFWEWQSWRASVFETAEFSLRNPSDGGPTERSEAAKEFGIFLEKYQLPLSRLKSPEPQTAVLQSMDQFSDEEFQEIQIRGSHHCRHFNAAYKAHQTLMLAGIPCDFINESQLDPGRLKRYKVLILPHVRIIAPETASAIAEFVRNGGALWADGRCGFLDRHHFLRSTVPGNGLDQVFGCREIDEVAPFETDRLNMKNGSQVKPYREIQRLNPYDSAEILAVCNGYPAAVRNRYGKGVAELWGTYLSGNPETDLFAFLPKFAEENGVQPEIRIQRGKDVIVSMLHGGDVLLAVFTSLAEAEQKVIAELPVTEGKLLNDVPATLSGSKAEFSIRSNETVSLLIKTVK